jgi:DNA mismatch repair protein MutS
MDQCVTPLGSRLLADWLANPLTSVDAITARLDAVERLAGDGGLRDVLRSELRGVYDLERLLARVATGRASPRDLSCVAKTLARLPTLKASLAGSKLAPGEAATDVRTAGGAPGPGLVPARSCPAPNARIA